MTTAPFRRLPAPILPLFSILALVLALPLPLRAQAPATATIQPPSIAIELPDAPRLAALQPASDRIFTHDPYSIANSAAIVPQPAMVVSSRPLAPEQHRFWDRENAFLFAATGGMATADFFVTHANLASGGHELNPLTRPFANSTPLLAANFAMETAGVIGVSYLFHKTGHHRLERAVSFVDIGGSAAAVGYDLAHR